MDISEKDQLQDHKLREEYFNEKFLPFLSQLYSYAHYLTKNESDAKDLLQETFIKAFKYMDKFQEGTNERAWLYKIMKNNFINDYRKSSRKPIHYSFENIYERADDEFIENKPEPNIEHYQVLNAFKGVMGDEVFSALESLSNEYKQILVLADIEDFTYEELSDILDIPIGTVRSRLFRARNLLKEKLYEYGTKQGFKDKRNK